MEQTVSDMTDTNTLFNQGLALMTTIERELRSGELSEADLEVAAEAENIFRSVIEVAPNHGRAQIMLGMLLNFLGRHMDAVPPLMVGMQLPKESADWVIAADTYVNAWFNMNQPAPAMPVLMEMVQHHPENVSGHFKLGLVYATLGVPQMAVPSLQKALELDPSHEGARQQLEALGAV